jgi:cell division protein FtsZ
LEVNVLKENKQNIPLDIDFEDNAVINIIDFDETDEVKDTIEAFKTSIYDDEPYIRKEREAKLQKIRNKMNRNYDPNDKSNKVSLDNPNMINKYENEPAYKRKQIKLENKPEKYNPNSSSELKIGIDEDEPIKKRSNSYLHDNVD